MSTSPKTADPQPQAPLQPGNDQCCHSGCTFCVLDMYQQDLEQYQRDLQAWRERQPDAAAKKPARHAHPEC